MTQGPCNNYFFVVFSILQQYYEIFNAYSCSSSKCLCQHLQEKRRVNLLLPNLFQSFCRVPLHGASTLLFVLETATMVTEWVSLFLVIHNNTYRY